MKKTVAALLLGLAVAGLTGGVALADDTDREHLTSVDDTQREHLTSTDGEHVL